MIDNINSSITFLGIFILILLAIVFIRQKFCHFFCKRINKELILYKVTVIGMVSAANKLNNFRQKYNISGIHKNHWLKTR